MSFVDAYTDFIFLEDPPERADIIFLPGSAEGDLARHAARLWREGYAPYLLPSGKYGKLEGRFAGDERFATEWEYFAHILQEEGVPGSAVLREDTATFTYENALRSREVTDAAGLRIRRAILCCQAYHARRAKLYYQVCFPEAEIRVFPVATKGVTRENWYLSEEGIRTVLSEVERCGSQFGEIFLEHMKKSRESDGPKPAQDSR